MAAVLFIITIPTKTEEDRLKYEFIARKLDLKSDRAKTTPANSTTTATTTTTSFPECAVTNDDEDTASAVTIDVPSSSPATVVDSGLQYGTFPKRKKSEQRAKLGDGGISMALKSREAGGSLKDISPDTVDTLPTVRKSWEGLRDILSSAKRKSSKKKDNDFDLEISQDTCMEIVLREILKKFHIPNAVWSKAADGRMHQIIFTIEFNETYERILDKFHEWGIGDREGSTVSVMNCIASKTFSHKDDIDVQNDFNRDKNLAQKQGAWERFMNSVRSRLNVAQIVRDVRQDAAITFDFVILLISAAILASFGLVEDSTIFLASSMLISPLMGPIIAAIFGTVIKDHSLQKLGLKNELFGILLATFVGFLFGLVVCTIDDRYSIGEGLTDEMMSRCELHSLLVGVFTAVPSGAAAAIGILGGNIGSLVGVAISASLLPPAVNSGVLWALAIIYKFFEKDASRYSKVVKTALYSQNQATELAMLGTISMCLTISNVICIYIMGIMVLKIKEIAPVIGRNNRQFWKHDIKIARDLNRNGFDTDTAIIDEFANLPTEDQKALGINYELLRNMHLDEATYQNTWSPIGNRYPFESHYDSVRENYRTVHRIERLYSTISNHHSVKDKRHKFSLARRPTGRVTDVGSSYKILTENLPRCSTMPSKPTCSNTTSPRATAPITDSASDRTSDINIPTAPTDDQKRRKFIVTPAEEDPLHYLHITEDIEV